jgi:Fe2+ transport system protein FeoA
LAEIEFHRFPALPTMPHTRHPATLLDLRKGEEAILDRIDLPEDVRQRLMELGFLPGSRVAASFRAPGGDPRVYRVDGTEVALRCETAAHLHLRPIARTEAAAAS